VFHEGEDVYVKMSDFGYSALMYEGDLISMVRTWPWYAPEIGKDWEFGFEDARRTDYYSFAVVCAFLLWSGETEDQHLVSIQSELTECDAIAEATRQGTLHSQIMAIVQSLKDVDVEQKQHLQVFFTRALQQDPLNRSLDLRGLFFDLAKRTDMGKMVFEDIKPMFFKRPEIPWAAQFKVCIKVSDKKAVLRSTD
jgi:hypothetical protein